MKRLLFFMLFAMAITACSEDSVDQEVDGTEVSTGTTGNENDDENNSNDDGGVDENIPSDDVVDDVVDLTDSLIVDGDFESGTTANWTLSSASGSIEVVTGDYAIFDNYSLHLISDGSNVRCYQAISVEKGKSYQFGFTGRHLVDAGVSGDEALTTAIYMAVRTTESASTSQIGNQPQVKVGEDTSVDYGLVTITDDVDEVYIVLYSAGGHAYFDNVYFIEVEAQLDASAIPGYDSYTVSDNMLVDGEFEAGASSWSLSSGCSIIDIANVDNYDYLSLSSFLFDDSMVEMSGASGDTLTYTGDVAVTEGYQYRFGVTGRVGDGSTLTMSVTATNGTALSVEYTDEKSSITSTENDYLEGVITIPSGVTNLSVVVTKSGSASAYVDNAFMVYEYVEVVVDTNLIVNGDFETGDLSPWTLSSNTGLLSIVSGDYAISGNYSLLLTCESAVMRCNQAITVEAGKTYEYGFTGRHLQAAGASGVGTASAKTMYLSLRTTESSGTSTIATDIQITANSGLSDVSRSSTVTIDEGVETVYVVLYSADYYAYFDDVYFREVEE